MSETLMNSAVGQHLRQCRKQRGISGNLLAKRAGLSQSTISAIEHGHKSPTVQTLSKLCGAMNLSLEDFFAGISPSSSASTHQQLNAVVAEMPPEVQEKLLEFLKQIY